MSIALLSIRAAFANEARDFLLFVQNRDRRAEKETCWEAIARDGVFNGRLGSGGVYWLLLATESPPFCVSILPRSYHKS